MNNIQLPPTLKKGDKVLILSPASKIDKRFLKGATERLESWGLMVELSEHAASSNGYYSSSIKHRLEDLQHALDDPTIKAILCSRGGYGVVHLVGKLDFTLFRQYPKWVIGFSDITILHNMIQHEGFASLHAPMARHLTIEPANDFCTLALKDILFGQFTIDRAKSVTPESSGFSYTTSAHKLNHKGSASGTLRGGNLAVAYGLRGTPWDIPAEGTILFIEDVGERPHAVERMIYNLKLGGVLEKLSGVIIGQFTEYEEKKTLGKELYGAIADLLKEYDYPVCFGFEVGHVTRNLPLINGANVTLAVEKNEVKLTFNLA